MPRASPSSAKRIGLTLGHAVAGWGLCGAAMFGAMAVTTTARALIIHAVAAPIIFAGVSYVYFRFHGSWQPLGAAAAFLGVVVALDLFVVALFIETSFEMFTSVVGTWLPFALIFFSTWCTGLAVRRQGYKA